MAMRPRPPRQPVGSAAWCAEERSSALQISQSEVEEFAYSARNELEWLNEHMADVFSENQINVVEVFKTPGKLRGKTPRTVRKLVHNENRVPLSDIFSATPKGEPNPFAASVPHNDRTPKFRIAEDNPASPPVRSSITRKPVPTTVSIHDPVTVADSGYYGSQSQDVTFQPRELTEITEPAPPQSSQRTPGLPRQPLTALPESGSIDHLDPTTDVFEDPVEPVKAAVADQARPASPEAFLDQVAESEPVPASSPVNLLGAESPEESSVQASASRFSQGRPEPPAADEINEEKSKGTALEPELESPAKDDEIADVTGSPSDGSSPIRPLVRKSSLNFASLPAREPMASNKSLGPRVSRTSHIDQARTSFYPRPTGGKSLGIRQEQREDDHEAMDIDEDDLERASSKGSAVVAHSKTYTQRLQDQISMLGKSQAGGARLSKSIPSLVGNHKAMTNSQSQPSQTTHTDTEMGHTPQRKHQVAKTPGAFHGDDEDDWIVPPTTIQAPAQSPRPAIERSYTAGVMEELHGQNPVGDAELTLPQHPSQSRASDSPPHPPIKYPDLAYPVLGHNKSASVDLPSRDHQPEVSDPSLRKIVSASNPIPITRDDDVDEPPKSPSRTFRESPLKHSALKQVKNKFSSILKNSKGLLASSAAISAEGKASLVNSPSTARLEKQPTNSTSSLRSGNEPEPLYPDLTRYASWDSQPAPALSSPTRPNGRRTRASAERDRKEQKQKDMEDNEAVHIANRMDKLEKEREKEREKARVFSKEQERITAAEKQLAAQKERERAVRTPAPKEASGPTRSSPRKAKGQQEADASAAAETTEPESADQDVEMTDGPVSKAVPASIPRPTPGSSLKNQLKRPTRPTREPVTKPKQAPTLIRVNTSSQNTGFHPSNSFLAATLESTLGPSQQPIKGKVSQPTLHNKSSQQSFNSSVNSTTGRPKALDLAAKRKQQEEKEAQRRRDAKAEIDRKRAAMREEERRQEQERRERERQQAAKEEEAKKKAQRQAAIEKAKQTRAPPPAVRSQPNAAPDYNSVRDKAGVPRPPSRLQHSAAHRLQEDVNRPVNAVLSSTSMSLKRPLQHDSAEDGAPRPAAPRSGLSQPKEVKRMRMSDEFDIEDEAEMQSYGTSLKGPPVRPSTGFKKDLPNKSLYSGYAPAAQGATRDIFKASVAPQHQNKHGHPLDMAQVSKGPIPFAANHHAAGPSHKTPARPKSVVVTKSAAKPRSSPRFQNGDNIELPEIQTDDDDDDDDDEEGAKALGVASWADTPALRRELMRQETVDPLQVFGPPAPLNMEEVFSKSKDRWHKFRARTSSANWSGADRLTEDEIRKDLAARDRMRREGGWTYELSKDM